MLGQEGLDLVNGPGDSAGIDSEELGEESRVPSSSNTGSGMPVSSGLRSHLVQGCGDGRSTDRGFLAALVPPRCCSQ